MITLYQFKPAFDLPNLSPFCMKVEIYLRMAGLPYQTAEADLRKAPKGKAPYIADNGRVVADSGLIVDYLKETYGVDLDGWLSPEQAAIGHALRRMLEESLVWSVLYARWFEPDNWRLVRQSFFGGLPLILRAWVPELVKRNMKKALWLQGRGRHSAEEIYELGKQDISALAEILGQREYVMGGQPSSLDAVAYASIANLIWVPMPSPLKVHAERFPQLEAYCQRMKARYFPPDA